MSSYLIQYGRSAFVGRFPAADADAAFDRGTRVVVRGPRGVELGDVLCPTADTALPADGDLLRAATPDDDAAAARLAALADDVLAAAAGRADALGLPLAVIDAELSLDGRSAVLHGLPWGECDASPLFAELSDRFGLAVRLLDVSRGPVAKDPPAPSGCGKPGCGSAGGGCSSCGTESGGGCSTGGCSRGKVKSAGELTAYFADLRRKMETTAGERTPLA